MDRRNKARLFAVSNANSLNEEEFRFLTRIATPERRAKAARFIIREDAARSLVAEALVRYSILSLGGNPTLGFSFGHNEFGKPFLALGDLDLEFNLSHSGEWVVCATSPDRIGVDIEKHGAIDLGIAERFFTPSESRLLDEVQNIDERLELFFDIWALKESYIKAIGMGLACPLDGFACLPMRSRNEVEFISYGGNLAPMYFRLIRAMQGYSCSVCSTCEGKEWVPEILSPSQLVAALQDFCPLGI